MKIALIIAASLAWWVIGYRYFKYWWLKDFDFTVEDRKIAMLAAVLGPLNIILGWLECRDGKDRVITPRRTRG
jgi:hypothetical protein